MDIRTRNYTVEDNHGYEFVCDAVILNGAGEWAAIWNGADADHVTYDGSAYISAPDDWRKLVLPTPKPQNYVTASEARAYDASGGPASTLLRDLAHGYTHHRTDLRESLTELIKVAQNEIARLDNSPEYIPQNFGIVQIHSLASTIGDQAASLETVMNLSQAARLIIDGARKYTDAERETLDRDMARTYYKQADQEDSAELDASDDSDANAVTR